MKAKEKKKSRMRKRINLDVDDQLWSEIAKLSVISQRPKTWHFNKALEYYLKLKLFEVLDNNSTVDI